MKEQKDSPYADIGRRLKAVREYYGYNQKDLCKAINTNPPTYNHWETGQQRLSLNGIIAICEHFEVDYFGFIYLGKRSALPHTIAMALESNPLVKASNKESSTDDLEAAESS